MWSDRYLSSTWTTFSCQLPVIKCSTRRLPWIRAMPTYQYRCEKCGKKFERTESISEHEATKPEMPQGRE
jgi:hypothetical protein